MTDARVLNKLNWLVQDHQRQFNQTVVFGHSLLDLSIDDLRAVVIAFGTTINADLQARLRSDSLDAELARAIARLRASR